MNEYIINEMSLCVPHMDMRTMCVCVASAMDGDMGEQQK
jgi:hypothetical protein